MRPFLRTAWAVLWKDLAIERRAKEGANALGFFAILLLFLFYFALGPDSDRIQAALPGLFWLAFMLAGVLGLGRAFALERENDCLDALILAPADKGAIYLGKLLGTTALMLGMEVVFIAATGIFYNLDIWAAVPRLLLVALAGTVGFAAVGTLFAAMTAHLRAREVLLPVLLLPLAVPVLLAAVKLTELALAGRGLGPGVAVVAAARRVRRGLRGGGPPHVRVRAGGLSVHRALGGLAAILLALGLWLGLGPGAAGRGAGPGAADHVCPRPRDPDRLRRDRRRPRGERRRTSGRAGLPGTASRPRRESSPSASSG